MEEGKDYYKENGYRVLTERFLARRGWCCSNHCRHCPYSPRYVKGNSELREDVKKKLTESNN